MVNGLHLDTMAGRGDNKRRHTAYDTYVPSIPDEGCLKLSHSLPVQPGWQQQQQQPAWNQQNVAEPLAARSASMGGGCVPREAVMGQAAGWVEGLMEPQLNRSQSSCSPYNHAQQGGYATKPALPRHNSGAMTPSAAGPAGGLLATGAGSWPRHNVPGLWALAEHAPLQHEGYNSAGSANAALPMQWSQQQSDHDTYQQGLRNVAVMQASRFSRCSSANQQQQQQQPPQEQNLALPRWSSEEIQCQLQLRPASEHGRGPNSANHLTQAAAAATTAAVAARCNVMLQPQQAVGSGFTFGAQQSSMSMQRPGNIHPQINPDPLSLPSPFHLDLGDNGGSSSSLARPSYPRSLLSGKPGSTELSLSPALKRMHVNSGGLPLGSRDMGEQHQSWSREGHLLQQQQQQPPTQQQEISWLQQAWLQEEQHDLLQQHASQQQHQGAVAPLQPTWSQQQGAATAIKTEAPLSSDSVATSCTSDSGSPRHSGQVGAVVPAVVGGSGLGLPAEHLLDQRAIPMAGPSGSGLPSPHGGPAPDGMRERFVSDGFREQAAAAMAGVEWEQQEEEGLLSTPSWLLGELLDAGGPHELKYIR